MENEFDPMPAIFSSIFVLKPCRTENTTIKAMTPMIIPKRVRNDRSLCAQMADIASFRVSAKFISDQWQMSESIRETFVISLPEEHQVILSVANFQSEARWLNNTSGTTTAGSQM